MTIAAYALPAVFCDHNLARPDAADRASCARRRAWSTGHWLSALARASGRMGFNHGTALLPSDEIASPISWGLMRR